MVNIAGGAINYLCQIIAGRNYTIEEFGIMNAVFSFLLVVGSLGSGVSMLVSKRVAESAIFNSLDNLQPLLRFVFYRLHLFTIGAILLSVLLGKYIGALFNIYDWELFVITILLATLSIYPFFLSGIFSGLKRFSLLGLLLLVLPVFKLIGTLLSLTSVTQFFPRVHLLLISMIVGYLLTTVIGCKLTKIYENNDNASHFKGTPFKIKPLHISIMFSSLFTIFLVNSDVILLKICFGANEAGLYSSALLFGRIVYYIITALLMVFLPYIASAHINDSNHIKILQKTITYTLLLLILFLLPINIFPAPILTFLLGQKFTSASTYVPYASLIAISLSLNLILLNYSAGINRNKLFVITSFLSCLIIVCHSMFIAISPFSLLTVIGITSFGLFVVNYLNLVYYEDKRIYL